MFCFVLFLCVLHRHNAKSTEGSSTSSRRAERLCSGCAQGPTVWALDQSVDFGDWRLVARAIPKVHWQSNLIHTGTKHPRVCVRVYIWNRDIAPSWTPWWPRWRVQTSWRVLWPRKIDFYTVSAMEMGLHEQTCSETLLLILFPLLVLVGLKEKQTHDAPVSDQVPFFFFFFPRN